MTTLTAAVTTSTANPNSAPALTPPGGVAIAALVEALVGSVAWFEDLRERGLDLTLKAHLKTIEEAEELAESLSLEEYADVIICLAAVALGRCWTLGEVAAAIKAKNETNRNRAWEQMSDGTWHHVTTPGADGADIR
jgi:hypothetical protein